MNPRSITVAANPSFPPSEYATFLTDYFDLDVSTAISKSQAQESQYLAYMLQQITGSSAETDSPRICVRIVTKAEFEGIFTAEFGNLQGDEIAVEDCHVTVIEKEFWWYYSQLKSSTPVAPVVAAAEVARPRCTMQWEPGFGIDLRISVTNNEERIDPVWFVAFVNGEGFWQEKAAVEPGRQVIVLKDLMSSGQFRLGLWDGMQWVAYLDFPQN